jgi:hypothetical protein
MAADSLAATQALKEAMARAAYQLADGFQIRTEYRRDYSSQPFFLTGLREPVEAPIAVVVWGQTGGVVMPRPIMVRTGSRPARANFCIPNG